MPRRRRRPSRSLDKGEPHVPKPVLDGAGRPGCARPGRRARRRQLQRGQPARGRAAGRALHLGGLQLVPARRPVAVEAEGRPGGRRPCLPCRLLGSARLEGSLRERRLHAAPGEPADQQRRTLQLHAPGRRRRPRSHRLACGRPLGRPPGGSDCGHARPRRRPLRCHRRAWRERAEAAGRVLGRHRARPRHGREGGRKRRRRPCITTSSCATTRRWRHGRRKAARPRLCASSRRPQPMPRIRAASTWSSSTRRTGDPCRP